MKRAGAVRPRPLLPFLLVLDIRDGSCGRCHPLFCLALYQCCSGRQNRGRSKGSCSAPTFGSLSDCPSGSPRTPALPTPRPCASTCCPPPLSLAVPTPSFSFG